MPRFLGLALLALLSGCAAVRRPQPPAAPWLAPLGEADKALHRRQYAEAQRKFQAALQKADASQGPPAADAAAESLRGLAFVEYVQGRYAQAEAYYARVLASLEAGPAAPPLEVVAALDDLAEVESLQGERNKAALHCERALALSEKIRGPEHPSLVRRLRSLALLYSAQGRADKAEEAYSRALALAEKAGAPEVEDIVSDLAMVYQGQNRLKEAEPLYRRALALREKRLGETPELVSTLNDLALFYEAQRRFDQAEGPLRRSLAILEKAYGPRDGRLAPTLELYSDLLHQMGRHEGARIVKARANALRGRAEGRR